MAGGQDSSAAISRGPVGTLPPTLEDSEQGASLSLSRKSTDETPHMCNRMGQTYSPR